MKQRRVDFSSDGILLVNKPKGLTSHDVVERVRRRFRPAKLGHVGTLDPFADGLLVLVFNQATRLADLMGAGHKTYQAVLQLGWSTDTGDCLGRLLKAKPTPPLHAEGVEQVLKTWPGEHMQAPPAYSAAKHKGRPLYAYARQGQAVQKPPRPIYIHEARLTAWQATWIEFVLRCSKGTYVRCLGEDLALSLGALGHLKALTRLEAWPFALTEADGLNEILAWSAQDLGQKIIPVPAALASIGLPLAEVDEDLAWQIRQGQQVPSDILSARLSGPAHDGAFQVMGPQHDLVAVLRWIEQSQAKPWRAYETIRVFN